jgi:hypothetical protein
MWPSDLEKVKNIIIGSTFRKLVACHFMTSIFFLKERSTRDMDLPTHLEKRGSGTSNKNVFNDSLSIIFLGVGVGAYKFLQFM